MPPVLRSILAVVAGAFVAFVLVAAIETLSSVVYPPPPGLDLSDPEAAKEFMEFMTTLPLGAYLFVLLAWGAGTFVGAWLAARLAGRAPFVHGLIVGGLLLAAGVVNMVMLPHPAWFSVAGVVVFLIAAFLGAKLAGRMPAPASTPAVGEPSR